MNTPQWYNHSERPLTSADFRPGSRVVYVVWNASASNYGVHTHPFYGEDSYEGVKRYCFLDLPPPPVRTESTPAEVAAFNKWVNSTPYTSSYYAFLAGILYAESLRK